MLLAAGREVVSKTSAYNITKLNYRVEVLNTNQYPSWQVQIFTKIFMNIMTNFIPNEIKRIVPVIHPG